MKPSAALSANREQVLAFRLDAHNLAERLQPGSLLAAAGVCAIQNTPPGTADLALHARIAGLMPEDIQNVLIAEKTLLQAWSLRTAPYLFPTSDAPVFTLGALPVEEAEIRFLILGVKEALERIGLSAVELVDLTAAALLEALDGRRMTKNELGQSLARRILPQLSNSQAVAWQSQSMYAAEQSLGESAVRFALPVVALRGLVCHTEREGNQAYLRRTDQWLGRPLPDSDRLAVQAELARRYLHAFGPSTALHFAEWVGIAPAQVKPAWKQIEPELVEIDFEGRRTWLLAQDLERLRSPRPAEGVRFLPPYDSFLQLRDRETLFPDPSLRRRVWRTVGSPGVLLVEGQPCGLWRTQKKGRRVRIAIETLGAACPEAREAIEAEAATLAPFRGGNAVDVEWE